MRLGGSFFTRCVSLALNIGTIFAISKLSGTMPLSIQLFINMLNGVAISYLISLINLEEIPS